MPVGGLTLRPSGDNWSWLAKCSVPLPPGTSEWLGLVSHSHRRNTQASSLCVRMHLQIGDLSSSGFNGPPHHHRFTGGYDTSDSHFSTFLINIHCIDLFSELAKKQLFAREINPDRSVALLFYFKTAGSRNMHMQIHRARHQLNVD